MPEPRFQGPISVLDYVSIGPDSNATDAIARSIELSQTVERAGYERHWFSEHHNTKTLACTAPELIIARVGGATSRIRVGAGGIMLPNHSPLKVAEMFHTLEAMFPGRVDLGLGRAPGTDGITALALRRSRQAVMADDFAPLAGELFAFMGLGPSFPEDHAFRTVMAAPAVPHPPEVWMLGSSDYGGRFAAVNGLPTAFAAQINPAQAVDVLLDYRRDFEPSAWLDEPHSMVSVNAFASEQPQQVRDFEAYYTLTMSKLRRNERTITTLEEAREYAASDQYLHARAAMGDRLIAGPPEEVVRELGRLTAAAEVDELMIVTPSPDHDARLASYELIAAELAKAAAA